MSRPSTKDIVVFGLQPWDMELGSNCKDIALAFAKTHRVLYINRPVDRISLIRRKADKITQARRAVLRNDRLPLQQVRPNLWVWTPPIVMESINWIPNYTVFQWFNLRNNQRLAQSIRQACNLLGFSQSILFNDSSMFMGFYLKKLLAPKHFIYYIRDYLISQNYFRRHGKRAEAALIAQADTVVCNSVYLRDYAKKHNPQSHYVGQGCDLSAFVPKPKLPSPFQGIDSPIIGYLGLLTQRRLDIDLLIQIAQKRPQWSLVLVGAEDEVFQKSALHQLTNVHFWGFQPPETLAQFIQHFDVCINPQVLNAMSKGNYPRKVDEYLAMGKPTVVTHTPTMEQFGSHVYTAKSPKEFIEKIETALLQDSPKRQATRMAYANSHTWENSANAIWEALETASTSLKNSLS